MARSGVCRNHPRGVAEPCVRDPPERRRWYRDPSLRHPRGGRGTYGWLPERRMRRGVRMRIGFNLKLNLKKRRRLRCFQPLRWDRYSGGAVQSEHRTHFGKRQLGKRHGKRVACALWAAPPEYTTVARPKPDPSRPGEASRQPHGMGRPAGTCRRAHDTTLSCESRSPRARRCRRTPGAAPSPPAWACAGWHPCRRRAARWRRRRAAWPRTPRS